MDIRLFDVQCGFGGAWAGRTDQVTGELFTAEMARVGIQRALARTLPPDFVSDVPAANAQLLAACAANPALVPCPIAIPNGGGDFGPEAEQLDRLIGAGAGAVYLRPKADDWSLAPWSCGDLLQALAVRRLPALLNVDDVRLDDAATLAKQWPGLPLILVNLNYRQQRLLLPLLKAFANVFAALGTNYCVHCGIEQLVREVGAARLLFGTGYPETDMMSAITQLMYAEIADEEKQLIGAGNLERLISECRERTL